MGRRHQGQQPQHQCQARWQRIGAHPAPPERPRPPHRPRHHRHDHPCHPGGLRGCHQGSRRRTPHRPPIQGHGRYPDGRRDEILRSQPARRFPRCARAFHDGGLRAHPRPGLPSENQKRPHPRPVQRQPHPFRGGPPQQSDACGEDPHPFRNVGSRTEKPLGSSGEVPPPDRGRAHRSRGARQRHRRPHLGPARLRCGPCQGLGNGFRQG